MDIVVARCAGLDVHKDTVVACVRTPGPDGRRTEQVRTFGTTTVELLALRDWLVAEEVTLVGMESTGVYWRCVDYVLEDALACWLANARHLRNVPGRKTDVQDAQWICQLVEHGLVRPWVVPPKPIRELRNPGPLPQGADRGAHPGGAAAGQGPAGRRGQAVQRGRRHPRPLRPRHAGRAGARHPRPGGAGRAGSGEAARGAPGTAAGAAGPLRRPPRVAGRPDPRQARRPRARRSRSCRPRS